MPYKSNSELPETVKGTCLNTDRIFTEKLSTMHGMNIKNLPKGEEMSPGKRSLIRLHGVQLKKCMKRIPKGNG